MAKLNLKLPVIDEKGEQVMNESTLGSLLGGILLKSASTEEANILKFFGWGMILGKDEELDLDKGDVKILKDYLVKNADLFTIVKAPILMKLDALTFEKKGTK